MRKICILLTIICFCGLIACNYNQNVDNSLQGQDITNDNVDGIVVDTVKGEEDMDGSVTKAWIMDQYKIEESELEGIDVEKIAESLWWTKADVLKEFGDDSDRLIKILKSSQKQWEGLQNPQDVDKDYISIWGTGAEGELPDFKDLKSIGLMAYYMNEEGFAQLSGYLDVKNCTIYYSENDDVSELLEAGDDKYQKYDVSQEEIQNIIGSINRDYLGKKLTVNNGDLWSIAFVYSDGSIYNYSLEEVNQDKDKLEMINLFFAKMEDKGTHDSFFELWQ